MMETNDERPATAGFALCICNDGYPVSLELNRVYRMPLDGEAGWSGMVRVVDESGEAYFHPRDFFHEIRPPMPVPPAPAGAEYRFAVCINKDEDERDLAYLAVYPVLPDPAAERDEWIRVIDESGEDYLYPMEFFRIIDVPEELKEEFVRGGS